MRQLLLKRTALLGAVILSAATGARAALLNQWAFEEPDGLSAPQVLDSAGSNHGTFQNMDDTNRSADVPAGIGSTRSLSFAGGDNFLPNDWVSLGSQITLGNTTDYTVATWYKGTDSGVNSSWGSVLLGRDNNDIHANFSIYNGKAAFIHHSGGWQQLTSTSNVNNGQWHHIAVVHYADQTADIYVDGVREVTGGNAHVDNSSFPYRINGFMRGFNQHYTQGLLDDARVYSHALTEAEVVALVPEPAAAGVLFVAAGAALTARRRSRPAR